MHPFLQSAALWSNAVLGFIYPEWCRLCDKQRAIPSEGYVCRDCQARAEFIEPPFCRRCGQVFKGEITNTFECSNCRDLELHFHFARSAVIARNPVLEAIHRFKYDRDLCLEPFLAGLLIRQAAPLLRNAGWHRIVPVPLHVKKQRDREFNQAARIARCLSRATGIPLDNRLLRRVQPTRTQTKLTREERIANVRRAFALCSEVRLDGQRIVLIDDVLTTGATTSECARVLRVAGAAEVCVWTIARGV